MVTREATEATRRLLVPGGVLVGTEGCRGADAGPQDCAEDTPSLPRKTPTPVSWSLSSPRPPPAPLTHHRPHPQAAAGKLVVEKPKWVLGKQFAVLEGQLYFMSLRDESKLKELEEWSKRTGVKPDRTFFR